MGKIKQILHGLSQSHRSHHLVGGFLVGLFFGFGAVVCVAGALEFKDVQHDGWNQPEWAGKNPLKWRWKSWDWVDFACTVAGGLVGSVLRWLAIGWFM
jgi:hypothetical protein